MATVLTCIKIFIKSVHKNSLLSRVTYIMLAVIVLALSQTGCGKKSTNNPPPIKPEIKRFHLGDPDKLYKGAVLNSKIEHDFFDTNDELRFLGANVFGNFAEQSDNKKIKSQEDLERENKAATADEANELTDEQKLKESEVIFKRPNPQSIELQIPILKVGLSFKSVSSSDYEGEYVFKISDKNRTEQLPFKLLHFSATPDKRHVSLLLRLASENFDSSRENDVELVWLLFARNVKNKAAEVKTNTSYFYLNGPGVAYRWPDRQVKLNLCGLAKEPETVHKIVKIAQESWQTTLNGRLQFDLVVKDNYAPFSDLNQNCLWWIEDYITEPNSELINSGMTVVVPDHEKHEFVDGDIFLFEEEMMKLKMHAEKANFSSQEVSQIMLANSIRVAMHEMGHFFGLDHQFTPGVQSLMSYRNDEPKLFPYDVSAIQALYPADPAATNKEKPWWHLFTGGK